MVSLSKFALPAVVQDITRTTNKVSGAVAFNVGCLRCEVDILAQCLCTAAMMRAIQPAPHLLF